MSLQAWRLIRRSDVLRRASVFAASAFFVFAGAATLSSLSLDRGQVATRDFGGYTARTIAAASENPRNWAAPTVEASESAIGPSASIALASPGFRLGDGVRTDIYYLETTWPSEAARVTISEGRWPTSPGEVVLVPHDGLTAEVGEIVTGFSGRVQLTVVGLATDYYTEQPKLLGARGTLATLEPALAGYLGDGADGASVLSPIAIAYWDEAQTTDVDVVDVLADLDAQDANTTYRRDTQAEEGWISKLPGAFAGPSVLILGASVAAAIGLIQARLRSLLHVTAALGGSHRQIISLVVAVTAAALALSAVLGSVSGLAIAALARRPIHTMVDGPLAPFRVPTLAVILVIVAFVGAVVATALTARRGLRADQERTVLTQPEGGQWPTALRRLLLSAVVAACIVILAKYSLSRSMIGQGLATAAGLLAIPDLFRVIPNNSSRPVLRLLLRRIRSGSQRATTAAVVLAALLALPLAWEIFLSTGISYRTAQDESRLRTDELVVADEQTSVNPPRAAVVAIADGQLDSGTTRIEVSYAGTPQALVVEPTTGQLLGVLNSVEDIEALLDVELNDTQESALRDGAVLTWEHPIFSANLGDSNSVTFTQVDEMTGAEKGDLPDTPVVWLDEAASANFDPLTDYARTHFGVALPNVLRRLEIASSPERVVYLGVSRSQSDQIVSMTRDAGFSVAALQRYERVQVVPPAAWTLAFAMLCLIMILATLAYVRSATKSNRRALEALMGLGASRRSVRALGAGLLAVPLCIALIVAVAVSVIPTLVSLGSAPGLTAEIVPFRIVMIVAVYITSAAAGVLVGSAQLTPAPTK